MAFIGDIIGGYAAKQLGNYNQDLYNQKAAINDRNAEIKRRTFLQVDQPRIKAAQVRNQKEQFVKLLNSGVDASQVGDTPYLVMLDQSIEDTFDLVVANYNSKVAYDQELNNSLLMKAQGTAAKYKGDMAFRSGLAKGAGDIYMNKDTYKTLLG